MIDISKTRIETPRLILRPWQDSDLEDFYAYASEEGVGEMAGWAHHQSMEESRKILNLFMEGKQTLALELRENGHAIGSLGLEGRDENLNLPKELEGYEIGYVLSREYWGRGLMPEAVQAVIDYSFRELKLDYLTCGHFLRNSQSARVIEKCGFRYLKDILYQTRMDTIEPRNCISSITPIRRSKECLNSRKRRARRVAAYLPVPMAPCRHLSL